MSSRGNHWTLGEGTPCGLLHTPILKGSGNPLNGWGSRENYGKHYPYLPCPALPQTPLAASCGRQNTRPLFWAAARCSLWGFVALIAILYLEVQFSPATTAIKTNAWFSTILLGFDALIKVYRTRESHQYKYSQSCTQKPPPWLWSSWQLHNLFQKLVERKCLKLLFQCWGKLPRESDLCNKIFILGNSLLTRKIEQLTC